MSRRNGIILGLVLVIVAVEVVILSPKEIGVGDNEKPATTAAATASTGPASSGQKMDDVYSVEAKGHTKEWELWAAQAVHPKESEDWTIERVKVKFYAKNGVLYTVTGKQGHVAPNDRGIRDIQIAGNVVTQASNGYVFKSEKVNYDSTSKKLASPGVVEMISPPDKDGGEMHLTGADMHADFSTNEITVNKNVETSKTLKDDGKSGAKIARIRSDRAVFSGRTRMAHFIGHVKLTMDGMTVTGPEASFQYGAEDGSSGGQLQSILIEGGVKMNDADRYATSDAVSVDFVGNKVVFKGSPRVTQNGDELTGDEIVFLNGGHQVQVVNAKAQIEESSLENAPQKYKH